MLGHLVNKFIEWTHCATNWMCTYFLLHLLFGQKHCFFTTSMLLESWGRSEGFQSLREIFKLQFPGKLFCIYLSNDTGFYVRSLNLNIMPYLSTLSLIWYCGPSWKRSYFCIIKLDFNLYLISFISKEARFISFLHSSHCLKFPLRSIVPV